MDHLSMSHHESAVRLKPSLRRIPYGIHKAAARSRTSTAVWIPLESIRRAGLGTKACFGSRYRGKAKSEILLSGGCPRLGTQSLQRTSAEGVWAAAFRQPSAEQRRFGVANPTNAVGEPPAIPRPSARDLQIL